MTQLFEHYLGDLLDKYKKEVTPKKKTAIRETNRIIFIKKHFPEFCKIRLLSIEWEDIQDLADIRFFPDESSPLKPIKASSWNRELNLISNCFTMARKWRYMRHNPLEDYQRPQNPEHRTRLVSSCERLEMIAALNCKDGEVPEEKRQYVALAWLIALETAMRKSEVLSITESRINVADSTVHLPDTKNGYARDVPLSPKAMEYINLLPKKANKDEKLFPVGAGSTDALFRKYRRQNTTIEDMRFHDSRHQAITTFVDRGYSIGKVLVMSGHRDIRQLVTYYNKTPAQIAKELAEESQQQKQAALAPLAGIKDLTQVDGLQDLIKMVVEQTKAA